MHIVALLALIVIIVFFTYEGYCNGLYQSTYLLMNHIIGFLIALTFGKPLAALVQHLVPLLETHPMPEYLTVTSVVVLFAVTRGAGSFLRQRFTVGGVDAMDLVDRIGGSILGLADGFVISGFTLIVLTLMPFLAYIPGDYGRIRTTSLPVDTGALMLNFYKLSAQKMGGGRPFLMENEPVLQDQNMDGAPDGGFGQEYKDVNSNGTWDRGWMWKYRNNADFTVRDVVRSMGETESQDAEGNATEAR